ncbi:MAG: GNAT family N-acetyltransferase [Actinomycetota bacterium]
MSLEIPLRAATPDEFPKVRDLIDLVFAVAPSDEGEAEFKQWLEYDRSIVADDGGELVATASTHTYHLTVPGGDTVPAGGLTIVTVKPTHRRRGLARRLLRRHLEDVRDHGEAVAMLYASESSIYGRFGFGSAVHMSEISIGRSHGAFRSDVPSPRGSFRLLDLHAAGPTMRRVFAEATAGIPGAVVPREQDWVTTMTDLPGRREGATPWRIAIYDRDGEPRGFARYRQKEAWGDGGPEGKVMVREVQAVDGEAFAALWRFVFDIDLAITIEAGNRPTPDPLRLLLADPRRLMEKSADALWVRIVDVATALSSRRYRVDGSLVIEVRDGFFEAGGRYRLKGGPAGATCERTENPADISFDVEHLGAVFLGGQSVARLAWVGLVSGDAAAIGLCDDMFSWSVTPANTVHF